MSVRVLVTGSRQLTDTGIVRHALNTVATEHPGEQSIVVHGDARGADRIARDLARAVTFTGPDPSPRPPGGPPDP